MMIASTKRGLYAANFGGGQVLSTNGKFVFQRTEAYLIKDGRISAPVLGDPSLTVFGKSGQGVPGGIGQPSLKIGNLTASGAAVWGQETVKAEDIRIEQETGASPGYLSTNHPNVTLFSELFVNQSWPVSYIGHA